MNSNIDLISTLGPQVCGERKNEGDLPEDHPLFNLQIEVWREMINLAFSGVTIFWSDEKIRDTAIENLRRRDESRLRGAREVA